MGIFFEWSKTKPSKLKRLKYLPRIGVSVDFAGRSFLFKNAPFLESVMNIYSEETVKETLKQLIRDPHALKNLVPIMKQQFSEISLEDFSPENSGSENLDSESLDSENLSAESSGPENSISENADDDEDLQKTTFNEEPVELTATDSHAVNLAAKIQGLSNDAKSLF